MPYLTPEKRAEIHNDLLNVGIHFIPSCAGDVNYIVSKLVSGYIGYNGLNYATVNEMIGALECAKLELYRMVAGPYEDKKMNENGEVY